MSGNNFNRVLTIRLNDALDEWVLKELHKLEDEFGNTHKFSKADVIRRLMYKEMRK